MAGTCRRVRSGKAVVREQSWNERYEGEMQMNNDTQRILEMLSEDKITVGEAERLLEALGGH